MKYCLLKKIITQVIVIFLFCCSFHLLANSCEINESKLEQVVEAARKGDFSRLDQLILSGISSADERIPELEVELLILDYEKAIGSIYKNFKNDQEKINTAFLVLKKGVEQFFYFNDVKKLSRFFVTNFRKLEKDTHFNYLFSDVPEFIQASSWDKESFSFPIKIFDGDYSSCWYENVKGSGVGEWVDLNLENFSEKNKSLNRLKISNGNAKNEQTFEENNRVKKALISLSDGQEKVVYLKDTIEPQTVTFNQTIVNSIRLTILDVYKGTKYNKTCISEIDFI